MAVAEMRRIIINEVCNNTDGAFVFAAICNDILTVVNEGYCGLQCDQGVLEEKHDQVVIPDLGYYLSLQVLKRIMLCSKALSGQIG